MQIFGSAASQAFNLFTQMRFWSDWTLDGIFEKQVGYEAGSMDKVDHLTEHMTSKHHVMDRRTSQSLHRELSCQSPDMSLCT
jgi:hypothetical protein